jgi:hypothetical protein
MSSSEPPSPYESTRREWTDYILSDTELPSNAKPEYRNLTKALRNLLSKLADHESMVQNMNQKYMEPAVAKTKVYFMWDFTGRTLGMLDGLDPSLPSSEKRQWAEVVKREAFGRVLINDTTGKINSMVPGDNTEFGPDVKAAAPMT